MGRPRKNLHLDDYIRIEDMAARGCGDVQIARAIGLDVRTLRMRLGDDPRAAAAFNEGRAEEEALLVGLLRRKALDGDTGAMLFLLRHRHGYGGDGPATGAPA